MINAGQSVTVAMKDQQYRVTSLIAKSPDITVGVYEFDLGRCPADLWAHKRITHDTRSNKYANADLVYPTPRPFESTSSCVVLSPDLD